MGFKALAKELLTELGDLVLGLALVIAGIYVIIYGIFERLQNPWFTVSVAVGVILIAVGAIVSLYARYSGKRIQDGLFKHVRGPGRVI